MPLTTTPDEPRVMNLPYKTTLRSDALSLSLHRVDFGYSRSILSTLTRDRRYYIILDPPHGHPGVDGLAQILQRLSYTRNIMCDSLRGIVQFLQTGALEDH